MLAFRIAVLYLNVWPINGDEAQYWDWAKHLDWGYYSKPPMVAWVIALTTKLFGNGALGLRLAAPLAYVISAVFIYKIGVELFSERVGFWSGITFLCIPGVSFSSSIVSTDPLLIMFWTLALYGLVRALFPRPTHHRFSSTLWWTYTGLMLGLGFYSKYAAVLFVVSLIVYQGVAISNISRSCTARTEEGAVPLQRKAHLATLGAQLLIIIIMLIPNIIWNAKHHFASIAAVSANADLSSNLFHPMNLLNFIGSQFGVFGPILFACLMIILIQYKQFIHDKRFQLLLIFTFVTLAVITLESLLSRAHANWSAPAYVAGTVLVCAVLIERNRMSWLWAALIIHLFVMFSLANAPNIVKAWHIPLDHKMTITSWPMAAKEIQHLNNLYPNSFVLVDDRMLLTQLLYFANIPLKQSVRWNPSGEITDQYDLVTSMHNKERRNFLLLTYHEDISDIKRHFAKGKLVDTIQLQTLDQHVIPLYIYYLVKYQG